MTPTEHSRDAYSVLVCLGATVGKEESINVAWCDLSQLHSETGALVCGHERVRIGKRRSLLLDCANRPFVTVADVDAHQLAVEVDETLSFRRPKIDAFGTRNRNRIHRGLGGPLEEGMA